MLIPAITLKSSVPLVDNHIHTDWTDGELSASSILVEAEEIGVKSIVFSEHSSATSNDWFVDFAHEVKQLRSRVTKVRIGTEVRICDFEGNLAIHPSVRKICDLVIASVHRFPDQNGKPMSFEVSSALDVVSIEMDLMISAIRAGNCDVIGHPFGMSLMRYDKFPSREFWSKLAQEASKYKVALELNSKYHSPEVLQMLTKILISENAFVSIGSDVHKKGEVGKCAKLIKEITNV